MIKSFIALGTFSLFICFCMAQTNPIPLGKTKEVASELSKNYDTYKEASLRNRRFKHADLQPLIDKIAQDSAFSVSTVGNSVEGRTIRMLTWGKGKTKLFLWSQMHGNEATATAALFDIFNFLQAKDGFDDLRKQLNEKLTLYIVPMLNPDGAERFTRENAFGVDLNRDARRLQFPEANLLKNMRDSLQADFGFNLHDQGRHHSIGESGRPATLSFLAPAFNYSRAVNPVRERAIRVISELVDVMEDYVPNQIGRYHDGFEPRAFGDNIQKWGTSTILIEAGGFRGDVERQFVRKLNFIAILSAMYSISKGTYKNYPQSHYYKIPTNGSALKELKIKALSVNLYGQAYKVDILMNRKEVNYNNAKSFYFEADVEDVGDLPAYFGYDEYNMEGFSAEAGKVYPEVFENMDNINALDFKKLYEDGYTAVRLKANANTPIPFFADVPLTVLVNDAQKENSLRLGQNPDLIIRKDGKVRYVLINGFVFDLEKDTPKEAIPNGLIYR